MLIALWGKGLEHDIPFWLHSESLNMEMPFKFHRTWLPLETEVVLGSPRGFLYPSMGKKWDFSLSHPLQHRHSAWLLFILGRWKWGGKLGRVNWRSLVGNELHHINIHVGFFEYQLTATRGRSLRKIAWPDSSLQVRSNARPGSWHGEITKGALDTNLFFLSRKTDWISFQLWDIWRLEWKKQAL